MLPVIVPKTFQGVYLAEAQVAVLGAPQEAYLAEAQVAVPGAPQGAYLAKAQVVALKGVLAGVLIINRRN